MTMESLTRLEIEYLAHHLFLPPQVPDQDDSHSELDQALMRTVLRSLGKYCDHVPEHVRPMVQATKCMMRNMITAHEASESGSLSVSETGLRQVIGDLLQNGAYLYTNARMYVY